MIRARISMAKHISRVRQTSQAVGKSHRYYNFEGAFNLPCYEKLRSQMAKATQTVPRPRLATSFLGRSDRYIYLWSKPYEPHVA